MNAFENVTMLRMNSLYRYSYTKKAAEANSNGNDFNPGMQSKHRRGLAKAIYSFVPLTNQYDKVSKLI